MIYFRLSNCIPAENEVDDSFKNWKLDVTQEQIDLIDTLQSTLGFTSRANLLTFLLALYQGMLCQNMLVTIVIICLGC